MVKEKKPLSLTAALFPLIMMAALVAIGGIGMGIDLQFVLLLSALISGLVAYFHGYTIDEMLSHYSEKVKTAFPAILILVIIGCVVGTWMFSGTVPYLISIGLTYLNPQYLAVTAFIVTAMISLFTGTSWGSVATSGVAFVGIAEAMGVPLPLVAGAVISGAVFGDKVSPISDTTNLCAMASELSVYEHIKGMLPNVIISGSIACILFLFLGLGVDIEANVQFLIAEKMVSDLNSIYNFNILLLLPAVLVFVGSYKGLNPLLLMLSASFLAVFLGIIFNGFSIIDGAASMMSGFNLSMQQIPVESLSQELFPLLNRGGAQDMIAGAVLFAFIAMAFGSFLEVTGSLKMITEKLLAFVNSKFSLAVVTFFSGATLNGVTGNGQFSILTIGQIFTKEYEERNVDKRILSRSMENSMTLMESLMPWHVSAVYFAGTLGVATIDYLPYTFFNILGILFFFILTRIQITKKPKADQPKLSEIH